MTSTGGPDATADAAVRSTVRRRLLVALGLVVVACLAYLAGSGGDLSSITDRFDGSSTTGDWSLAEAVAADTDAGIVASVELAPSADGDGRCMRVRVGADLTSERCSDDVLNPWDDPEFEIVRLSDYFGSIGEYAVRNGDRWTVALAGAVHPDVTRVTAHFGDGSQYSFVTRDTAGWFAVVLPSDVADPDVTDGHLVNAPFLLELFDDAGTRVASVDLRAIDPGD